MPATSDCQFLFQELVRVSHRAWQWKPAIFCGVWASQRVLQQAANPKDGQQIIQFVWGGLVLSGCESELPGSNTNTSLKSSQKMSCEWINPIVHRLSASISTTDLRTNLPAAPVSNVGCTKGRTLGATSLFLRPETLGKFWNVKVFKSVFQVPYFHADVCEKSVEIFRNLAVSLVSPPIPRHRSSPSAIADPRPWTTRSA